MQALLSQRATAPSVQEPTGQINEEEGQGPQRSFDEHAAELSESQALGRFYQATKGRTWVRQNGWRRTANANAPHCRLHGLEGVTIGSVERITSIRLRDNNLRMLWGSPQNWSMLSSLRCLTALDLSRNCLRGNVPSGLSALLALEDLNLDQNKLCGQIPAELGRLHHLKRLRLSNNDLSGYIPTEVKNMATLELLDCSNNELLGLLPAWACMGIVHAAVCDPHPSKMYLFVMDASPKSMRMFPASTWDEEARLRAAAWIQWHLNKSGMTDGPFNNEEQSPASSTHLSHMQVLPVALPQHDRFRFRFDVELNENGPRITALFGKRLLGTVVGAVTEDTALTSFGDFPHKVIEINEASSGTARGLRSQTSLSAQATPREQDGELGVVHVDVRGGSVDDPAEAVGMNEYQQVEARRDSSVDRSEVRVAITSSDSPKMPAPRLSYSLTSDDLFVEKWEDFERWHDRFNNKCCYFVHNFVLMPLLDLVRFAALLSPLLGGVFFFPLVWLLRIIGVVLLVYLMARCGDLVMRAPSFPAKLTLSVAWGLACYCLYWFVRYKLFICAGFGAFALMVILPRTVVLLLVWCGVRPASSRWKTFGVFPLRDLPVLTLTVEPADRAPGDRV